MTTQSSPTLISSFSAADAGVPLGQPALELIGVPLDQIVPCRWQPRQQFAPDALLDLANDIAQHGVLTPPLVWRNEDLEYELIAGERRIRACYALFIAACGHTSLQSAVEQVAQHGFANLHDFVTQHTAPGTSSSVLRLSSVQCREVWGKPAQLHELALVDNLQRADLTPLEEAHGLHDLIQEYSYTQRQLAERLGKSQTWISQRLTLLNLAPAVADQVTANTVDPATAREIARLAPAVQPAALQHLQEHGMKSKAAQHFVQTALDLSDPEHYTDAAHSPLRRLTQIALQQIPDAAARQAAVVAYARTGSTDGKLTDPQTAGEPRYRDLLAQTGIAGVGKNRSDVHLVPLWQQHAPAAGYTCAACQLNPHRGLVCATNDLVRANGDANWLHEPAWPQCAPGVATCPAYVAPEATPRLPLPWLSSKFVFTPEEEAAIAAGGEYGRRVTAIAPWAAIIRRHYAQQQTAKEQQKDTAAHGLAHALARYLTLQRSGDLVPDHVHHQPCARCVFHKVDADDPAAHCHWQAQPPDWSDTYDTAIIRLWESGNTVIGRCRLFRLKQPEVNLPDLPGAGIGLPPDGWLHLLKRVSARDAYSGPDRWGPRWFDCKRTKAQEPPSWSNCEPVLGRLFPELSPGRRLALVMLWEDPFTWGTNYSGKISDIDAYIPRLGRTAPFTLKETITRA